FYISITIVFLITFIFPNLSESNLGNKVDFYIQNITGKSLFTGREYIWLNTINLVSEKPYFGYGMSARLPDLMMTKYDAHNTYLQITLETGYIGLILYLLILYKLWRLMFIDVIILNNNINYLKVFLAFF